MKLPALILLAFISCASMLCAQTANDLNAGLQIDYDSSEELEYKLSWWGAPDTYFFIQHTESLTGS